VTVFVARLPSPYREAITLTELQGATQKSAAEMLNVPLTTLKSRVTRGRERIRQMFEECCIVSVDSRGRVIQCEARDLSEVPRDCHGIAREWTEKQKSALR
jgi:RNA polymerase sigma-70 factor (ECF subfamily)